MDAQQPSWPYVQYKGQIPNFKIKDTSYACFDFRYRYSVELTADVGKFARKFILCKGRGLFQSGLSDT